MKQSTTIWHIFGVVRCKCRCMASFFRNIIFAGCITIACSFVPFRTMEGVTGAMQSGNADALARYFDKMVDITLHDKMHAYSRSQAAAIIRDFFKCYDVESFEVAHKGMSNGAEYCVGKLQTRHGSFTTTILMRFRSDKKVLQELRFTGVR